MPCSMSCCGSAAKQLISGDLAKRIAAWTEINDKMAQAERASKGKDECVAPALPVRPPWTACVRDAGAARNYQQ